MNAPTQEAQVAGTQVPAASPSAPAVDLPADHNPLIEKIAAKFHFKSVKDEESKIETKRPTIEFTGFPVISIEGIRAAFNAGGKQTDLLLEACRQVQFDRARELVNEDANITAENFPFHLISWEAISLLEPKERKYAGIAAEVWTAWAEDYVAVMKGATGKKEEDLKNQAKIFVLKFAPIKTKKDILKKLDTQLGIYLNSLAENHPNAEQYAECVEYLLKRSKTLQEADDTTLLANLGL